MTKQKPVVWELSLDQIRDIATEIAQLTDAQQIYYFGSRKWDEELSFGMVEFLIVTPRPFFYTQAEQEEIFEKLTLSFEALFTFIENETEVMTGAMLMWPPKS